MSGVNLDKSVPAVTGDETSTTTAHKTASGPVKALFLQGSQITVQLIHCSH